MNQEEMDSTLLKLAVQDYRKFITECKLVEKEVLPTYAKEIVFRNLELKTAFDKKQAAHALFEYAIPRDAHDFSAQVERIHEQPSLQLTPFAEINWSIDLELLRKSTLQRGYGQSVFYWNFSTNPAPASEIKQCLKGSRGGICRKVPVKQLK